MTERKKPNNKRLILMIVLLAVVIALMWLLPDGSQPAAPATNAPKTEQTKNTNDAPDDIEATTLVKAGTQAPDFRVEMFDGTTFTLGSLRGKVVLLNFWATWCGPCRGELPYLKEAFKEFGPKGFNIYGVSLDNDAESWKEFLVKEEMTWPNVIAVTDGKSAPIVEEYGIRSIPTNFLISPEGKIVAKDLRGEGIKEKLAELVK